MRDNSSEFSRDTGPLNPEDLSKGEVIIIQAIEARLNEAQGTDLDKQRQGRDRYLAVPEYRHPRVILIDGSRGTGKTSLMLTLIERWHQPVNEDDEKKEYAERQTRFDKKAEDLGLSGALAAPPTHVRVLEIADFDSLPPGMPLIAALVQVWRPLILEYDLPQSSRQAQQVSNQPLMDHWHRLFGMAAAGWSSLSKDRGLVEQVLDREEQVEDWHYLDMKWRELVDKVILRGQDLVRPHKLDENPVFVVMIDDCDLQVGRVRELLPALRLLYHPRVIFIVAADRPHMVDMLSLDFLGQQNRLANSRPVESGLKAAREDRWASRLAEASFDKVFPLRNRFPLPPLSLRELLEFNISGQSFKAVLNLRRQRGVAPSTFEGLGTYLSLIAGSSNKQIDVPGGWTYRTAHQILEGALGQLRNSTVLPLKAKNDEDVARAGAKDLLESLSEEDVARAIGRLLARGEYESMIRVLPSAKPSNTIAAPNAESAEAADPARPFPQIEYLEQGKLEAFFPQELVEDLSESGEIVLSAQPHFRFETEKELREAEEDTRKSSAIMAISLQDDGFGVIAPRLQWDARLALVWTRMTIGDDALALHWTRYRHPSPLRLLRWAADWRDFITGLRQKTDQRPDRIAYAWVYYQLRWMGSDNLERDLEGVVHPLDAKFSDSAWTALLKYEAVSNPDDELDRWKAQTLPLLARPEIGLSPRIQRRLLKEVKSPKDRKRLKDQRRRLITDAIFAAADEFKDERPRDANRPSVVSRVIREIEARHLNIYPRSKIWWNEIVEGKKQRADGRQPKISDPQK